MIRNTLRGGDRSQGAQFHYANIIAMDLARTPEDFFT